MKRKATCILLLAVLCFTQIAGTADSYVPEDVKGSEYEAAFSLLNGLSIMHRNDDATFRPNTAMTRAEFAEALANIYASSGRSDTDYFKDVPKEHKLKWAVEKLVQLNLVRGDGNASFRPDEAVTVSEAVKMLITALGYQAMAESMGGYPAGYLNAAAQIELTRTLKIGTDGALTRGEAAKLIAVAVELPMAIARQVSKDGQVEYSTEKERTLLSEMMNIEKIKGLITANSLYAVADTANAPKKSIKIDDEIYYSDGQDYDDMVGYRVTCYYRNEKSGEENTIVYLHETEGKNTTLEISAENSQGFSFPYLYYGDDTSASRNKISVSSNLIAIYNGKPLKTVDDSYFSRSKGELNFLDNDSDDVYDIVWIWEYQNMMVSQVADECIYNLYETDQNIDFRAQTFDKFSMSNANGGNISLADIKKNDVLSVFYSEDRSVLRLVQSSKTVTGKADEVTNDGADKTAVIDSVVYKVDENYTTSSNRPLYPGAEGTFALDAYGYIYSVLNEKSTLDRFGYLIQAILDSKRIDKRISVRILEDNGKVAIRSLVGKPTIDGRKYTNMDNALARVNLSVLNPVVYRTDMDGEITMLDTPLSDVGDDKDKIIPKIASLDYGRYKTNTRVFEGKLPVGANTIVFLIPSDPQKAEDQLFGTTDYKYFQNDADYRRMSSFVLDASRIISDVLVLKDTTMTSSGGICMLDSISQALNSSDETVGKLTVYDGSTKMSYYTETLQVLNNLYGIIANSNSTDTIAAIDPSVKLAQGDVVKFFFNNKAEITKICLIYKADTDTMYSLNPYFTDFHAGGYRYAYGEISETAEGIVELPIYNSGSFVRNEYFNLSAGAVFVYHSGAAEKVRVTAGNMADATDGRKIVAITKGGTPYSIFIYK